MLTAAARRPVYNSRDNDSARLRPFQVQLYQLSSATSPTSSSLKKPQEAQWMLR